MKRLLPLSFLMLTTLAHAQTTTAPAPSEVYRLKSQIVALKAQVADLQKQLVAARKPAVTIPQTPSTAGMTTIEKAIAEHRVVNGMTPKQVDMALGVRGECHASSFDDPNGRLWIWGVESNVANNTPGYVIQATLLMASWWKLKRLLRPTSSERERII